MKLGSLSILFLIAFYGFSQDINKLADAHIQENGVQILQDFKTLLSIPNVAFDLPNINKNASHIIEEFEQRGVEMKLLRMVGTPPIVYGYYPVKNAKQTIAFYVHYDGQPVDKTKWTQDPWQPTYYSDALFNDGQPMEFPSAVNEIDENHGINAREKTREQCNNAT